MAKSPGKSRLRAMSMPIAPSYSSHVQEIDMQLGIPTLPFEDSSLVTFNPKVAMKSLSHSLRACHVDVSGMAFERLRMIISRMQTSVNYREVFRKFLKQPMQVSNHELSNVLQLRDAMEGGEINKSLNDGRAHRFYVRSWAFRPCQLLSVVQSLRARGFTFSELDEWEFQSRAEGSPNSRDRFVHLEAIWAKKIPELQLVIPHLKETYDKWIEEFSGLHQGQSYFLKVLSRLSRSEYLMALSNVRNSVGRHKKREAIQADRVELSPRIRTKDMQGFPVEVKPNGDIKIKWLTSQESKKTLTLEGITCAIPVTGLQCRALSFTEHRVDIVDANGNPLRPYEPWAKTPSLETLPRWTFKSKSGQMLQELWEAVRSELGHELPTDRIRGVPPKINGVGLVPSNSKTETPKQNRPPHIKDANYLLYNFLNERFPNGGVFRTISRAKDESSSEDLQEFVKFCRRQENIDHPYSAKWLQMLDRPKPFIAILAPNIRVYRSCGSRVTNPYSPLLKCHYTETILELGPPVL